MASLAIGCDRCVVPTQQRGQAPVRLRPCDEFSPSRPPERPAAGRRCPGEPHTSGERDGPPVLLLRLYGDVLAVWRPWVRDPCGHGLDCGHHMAEEAPELLADELRRFLRPP